MFCGLQYRMLRRLGGARLHVTRKKTQTLQRRNEAQLNCIALRSELDYEVAWTAVKGKDERPKMAPLTALHASREVYRDVGKKKERPPPATSALTFYDLLIEEAFAWNELNFQLRFLRRWQTAFI